MKLRNCDICMCSLCNWFSKEGRCINLFVCQVSDLCNEEMVYFFRISLIYTIIGSGISSTVEHAKTCFNKFCWNLQGGSVFWPMKAYADMMGKRCHNLMEGIHSQTSSIHTLLTPSESNELMNQSCNLDSGSTAKDSYAEEFIDDGQQKMGLHTSV